MTELKALLEQREALNVRIAQLQHEQKTAVIAEIRGLMAENGITLEDLQASLNSKGRHRMKVALGEFKQKRAPKYRHPETGKTWTGLGKRPQWVHDALAAGQSLEAFAIEQA